MHERRGGGGWGRRAGVAAGAVAVLAALLATPNAPGGAQEAGGDLDPPGVGSALEIPERPDLPEVDVAALEAALEDASSLTVGPEGVDEAVTDAVADEGTVRVMVELAVAATAEGYLAEGAAEAQRDDIAAAAADASATVEAAGGTVHRTYQTVPWIAAEVDAEGLDALAADAGVRSVQLDAVDELAVEEGGSTVSETEGTNLTTTQTLLGNAGAWSMGYQGQGRRVAIFDTGVQTSHDFFSQQFGGSDASRADVEVCFSQTGCPGGGTARSGPGTGQPCTWNAGQCEHGSHVAGIAAGGDATWSGSGPAREAGIIAVAAAHDTNGSAPGGNASFSQSDQVAALDWLFANRGALALAAINMSISGGGPFNATCNTPVAAPIANLFSARIPTVIATGNDSFTTGVGSPSCLANAIGVGNTRKDNNTVWPSSNSGNGAGMVDLLAPGSGTPCGSGGQGIISAIPGDLFGCKTGTSMAAPHVAGLATLMKQKHPSATVPHLLASMQVSGLPVTDSRNNVTRSRITVDAALRVLFRDVPVDSPFWFEIGWMAFFEITTGFNNGRDFQPGSVVSRQAMAAFIYRFAGSPAFSPPGTATFNDVPTNHPFFHEIEWLATTGITGGYPDGGFHPAERVTRQAMSAFMFRGFGNPAFVAPAVASFNDVPTNHPFFREIEWMAAQNITGGFPDGGFHPSAGVSRQAMAAFMFRLANP